LWLTIRANARFLHTTTTSAVCVITVRILKRAPAFVFFALLQAPLQGRDLSFSLHISFS
jgi:hypothetical protein